MGRTESLFAGILLVTLLIAVLMVVFRADAVSTASVQTATAEEEAEIGSPMVAFTGDREGDLCLCYEQAYAFGNSARTIESVAYRGGFATCTRRLGRDGANAWTWGWANGAKAPGTPKTCRGYYAAVRVKEQERRRIRAELTN